MELRRNWDPSVSGRHYTYFFKNEVPTKSKCVVRKKEINGESSGILGSIRFQKDDAKQPL